MKLKKFGKVKRIIIVEIIAIIILIIGLVSGIKVYKQGKEKVYEQIIEENITKAEMEQELETEDESKNLYIVDLTETEENKTVTSVQNKDNKENTAKYYIKVNYGAQVVTIYSKDKNNDYTVPIKAMVCSTGACTPTSGVYTIPGRWIWGLMQGNVYAQYVTKITGNILFHSVPYTKKDPSTLEYWEYDKLGTPASLGCVRLKAEDAKWIYNNCANGTKVEFYSDSNPGPLGKPTAKKISNYPDYLKNWDPTDPNSSNPWHTYTEGSNANNQQNTNVKNEVEKQEKNEIVNKVDKQENDIVNEVKNTIQNEANIENNNVVNQTKDEQTNQLNNQVNNDNKNEIIASE